MSSKEFDINGTDYTVTITEQVIGHVNNLKNLYNAAYEDPESFEQVSAEISSTIKQISNAVEPEINDENLDKFSKEIKETDWDIINNVESANEKYTVFESKYREIYDRCFPDKKKRNWKRKCDKPWIIGYYRGSREHATGKTNFIKFTLKTQHL